MPQWIVDLFARYGYAVVFFGVFLENAGLPVPGETMLVLETSPAAYVSLAANEAEKAAQINVVNVNNIGRFGRMFLAGDTSQVQMARDAAVAAVSALTGRT